jgi:hypothetical protein
MLFRLTFRGIWFSGGLAMHRRERRRSTVMWWAQKNGLSLRGCGKDARDQMQVKFCDSGFEYGCACGVVPF